MHDATGVAPGIRRLTQGVVNFYLVEEGGAFTLIDAGAPRDWDHLVRVLSSLGRSVNEVEAVVLTHAHADHTGFAERARTTASASVWVHEGDLDVARGGKPGKNDGNTRTYLFHAEFYRTVFSLVRRGASRIIPILQASAFADGQRIDAPGGPMAVHAPGHTPGSCALLVEDRGALLTGDVLVTRNPLTGRVGPQIMPSGFNRDTDLAMRSLDALESVGAGVVLPGHGEPWESGVAEAVRLARAAGPS